MTTLAPARVALLIAVALAAAARRPGRRPPGPARTRSSRAGTAPAPPIALDDAAGGWRPGSTGGPGLDSVDDCADPAHGFLATVSGIVAASGRAAMAWWRFVAPRGHRRRGRRRPEYSGYARPFDGQSEGIVYLRSAAGAIPAIDARLGRRCRRAG